jgi:Ankyrin repeats (3 copies)
MRLRSNRVVDRADSRLGGVHTAYGEMHIALESSDICTQVLIDTVRRWGRPLATYYPELDEPLLTGALRNQHFDVADALVEVGADVEARTAMGDTTLMRIAQVGSQRAVEWLLARGANANAFNLDNATPLYRAAVYNTADTVRALVYAGADVSRRYWELCTVIHLACWKNVEILCRMGADVSAHTAHGRTRLSMEVDARRMEHVIDLLRFGADYRELCTDPDTSDYMMPVIAGLGGEAGVRAAHQQWRAEAPGRRTKSAAKRG